MKCKVFRILVVLTIAAFALLTQAETAGVTTQVTGYAPGDFAVKGAIEWQLTNNVVKPLQSQLAQIKNGTMRITVVGYADHTGRSGANDEIAMKRAENVANFLHAAFPQSYVTHYSKGDAYNSRSVDVSALITDAPPALPKEKPDQHLTTIILGIIAIGLIIVILNSAMTNNNHRPPPPAAEPTIVEPSAADVEEAADFLGDGSAKNICIEILSVEWNGGKYLFPLTQKTDGWHTGLPKPWNFRKKLSDAKKAVEGFLKDSKNQPAIEELIINRRMTRDPGEES